ncbi:hypothetical protein Scep_005255 [Stephania cephalantha]|uniref:Thaumatin-like protein n=1 Tax=Stephania cephalantha TaxID=152367 RepID=A0AAP0PZX0_9MAGN
MAPATPPMLQLMFFLIFSQYFVSGTNTNGGTNTTTFTLQNNCAYTIWPATLSGAGSSQLPESGFELKPNGSISLDVSAPWSGRFWARTVCSVDNSSSASGGRFRCGTGDCGSGRIECNGSGGAPPATLVELTLDGYGGLDFYDISLVDGFNLPISIDVQGSKSCKSVSCAVDLNALCPAELSVVSDYKSVVGCKSGCDAFNEPRYCCTGAYSSPSTCNPTNYSNFFKKACPQAYSYAFDDSTSIFTCPAALNYLITFCP